MKHILLDTNILVDLGIRHRDEKDPGIRLLRTCQQGKLHAYATGWSVMSLMYLMDSARNERGERMCSKAEVMAEASALLTFVTVIDANNSAFAMGLAMGWADWEDAIIYAAGDSHPLIEAVVTNDKKFRNRTKKLPGIKAIDPAVLVDAER
ncbi:MAG: hypothetical protein IT225_02775 [Flavobacteriales bacterium]|jgi:predicted nucleic acid-binding protein|nr:hypothetical protein [Flavobacteriales bacterium]